MKRVIVEETVDIAVSDIVTAFDQSTIGTKVVDREGFVGFLVEAMARFEFPENGQGFIQLPDRAIPTVSCGVARRQHLTVGDYVVREHRGAFGLFARRERAVTAENVGVVVYTREAYLADPEVGAAETERIADAAYIIVAVIASSGPKPPVSSHRFVRNLAGGNRRYSPEEGYTLGQAIKEAKAIVAYEAEWITVAD